MSRIVRFFVVSGIVAVVVGGACNTNWSGKRECTKWKGEPYEGLYRCSCDGLGNGSSDNDDSLPGEECSVDVDEHVSCCADGDFASGSQEGFCECRRIECFAHADDDGCECDTYFEGDEDLTLIDTCEAPEGTLCCIDKDDTRCVCGVAECSELLQTPVESCTRERSSECRDHDRTVEMKDCQAAEEL